jgi:hypothetical protein
MQNHITRTRLAGEPPYIILLPQVNDIGLMEFTRAKGAIVEGPPASNMHYRYSGVTYAEFATGMAQ